MSSLDNVNPWLPPPFLQFFSPAPATPSLEGVAVRCFIAASLMIGLKPVLAAANTSGMFCSGLRYTGDTALHLFLPGGLVVGVGTLVGPAGRRLLAS